jgi:serine/threonine protein kinase
MVMELGDENLSKLIERSHTTFPHAGGPGLYTPPDTRKRIWSQIVDIISTLHANNTVHMDLKPDNFLVFGNTLKIADLGISKKAHVPGYNSTNFRCSMPSLFPSLTF